MARFAALLALLAAAAPALADDSRTAAVVLADDGGLDRVTSRTLRSLVATELRKHGLSVSDDPKLQPTRPVDGALQAELQMLGIRRLFVLRVGGRLERKVPLALEETDPERLTTVVAADLVA